MHASHIQFVRLIALAICISMVIGPALAYAEPVEIVVVHGQSTDTEEMFMAVPYAGVSFRDAVCSTAMGVMAFGLPDSVTGPLGQVISVLGSVGLGIPMIDETNAHLLAGPLLSDFCSGQNPASTYNIIYSSCSMSMWSGQNSMRLVLPSNGAEAEMQLFSPAGALDTEFCGTEGAVSSNCGAGGIQVLRVRMRRLFDGDQSEQLPLLGRLTADVEVTPQSGQRQILGVPAREHSFSYEGKMNPLFMDAEMQEATGGDAELPGGFPFGDITMRSEGTAWLATDVPGLATIQAFYANYVREVVPNDDSGSLLGGVIAHVAKLTEHGIPLEIIQDMQVSIASFISMGMKSHSEGKVLGVMNLMSDAEWCELTEFPDDWEIVDMDDLMSGAAGGGGPSGGGSSPGTQNSGEPTMADAMQQMNEAMAQMTPEQREMMEQFGMGGAMGAAAGGGAGGGAAGNVVDTSSSNCAGSGFNSADLTTDDLTESVQKHLDALGYDTGNTDGEASVMTSVAISQFQAENGMDVTGEVSPQLLGALAAEVDKC